MDITKFDRPQFFLEAVRQLTGGIYLALCLDPEKKQIELRDSTLCYDEGTNVREYFDHSYLVCFTVKGSGVNLGNVVIPKDSDVLDILKECMNGEIVSFQTAREFTNEKGEFIAGSHSLLIIIPEMLEYKILDGEIPNLYKGMGDPADTITTFMDCLGNTPDKSNKVH